MDAEGNMMETGIYEGFAYVYDLFMEDVIPYGDWSKKIIRILRKYGVKPDATVCDLGCGTGIITKALAMEGYQMIGIDRSTDMLDLAAVRSEDIEEGAEPLAVQFFRGDIRNFALYDFVDAFICTCDSINYVLEDDELFDMLDIVADYLKPGGLFIFDIKTRYTFEHILADNTFAETVYEGSYIWENHYDPDTELNEYDLTIYSENGLDAFYRFHEYHQQRAYDEKTICEMLDIADVRYRYGQETGEKGGTDQFCHTDKNKLNGV